MQIRIHRWSSTIVLCFFNNKGIALSTKLKDYKNFGKILFWTFNTRPNDWELIYEN